MAEDDETAGGSLRRSNRGGSGFSDVLSVDTDAAAEEDEEIVDLEEAVVVSDGGFVEDADGDLEAAGAACEGMGSVEEGRLSRSSWYRALSISLSRSSLSLAQSWSPICWILIWS